MLSRIEYALLRTAHSQPLLNFSATLLLQEDHVSYRTDPGDMRRVVHVDRVDNGSITPWNGAPVGAIRATAFPRLRELHSNVFPVTGNVRR